MAEEFTVQIRVGRNVVEGELVEIKLKIKHPSTTGLGINENAANPYERFIRNEPAQFIRQIDIYYGEDKINEFIMNSTTSNDPLIAFKIRAVKEEPIRAVVTNHLQETIETSADIAYS